MDFIDLFNNKFYYMQVVSFEQKGLAMRRSFLPNALLFLRIWLSLILAMAALGQNWPLVLGITLAEWAVFIAQDALKKRFDPLKDVGLAAYVSILLAIYFGTHHNPLLSACFGGSVGVMALLFGVLLRLDKKHPRLRWAIAWTWLIGWQSAVLATLVWLAFS